MAGKWLPLVTALVGFLLHVHGADIVHEDSIAPTYEDLGATTTGYDVPTEPEQAPLTCYDCTSYMPSCKRRVTDVGGAIVSRTGCKTKCFLRVGEEQSGALYRGCMDDFITTAQLTQDYVGCKVQEWNGRKSLWCLCDNDLCNGQSLKSLFYYGYGSPDQPQYTHDEGPHRLEEHRMDDQFEEMTSEVDNYNSHYAIEAKVADGNTAGADIEPIGPVDEVVELTSDGEKGYDTDLYPSDQPEAYADQQPPQGYGADQPEYSEPKDEQYPEQAPADTEGAAAEGYPEGDGYQPYGAGDAAYGNQPVYPTEAQLPPSPGYAEEHHLPFPTMYPLLPEQYEQFPQYPLPPPEGQYPAYVPYQYPTVNSEFKFYGEEQEAYPDGEANEENAPLKTPEGKSADVSSLDSGDYLTEFYKYPQEEIAPYPFHYHNEPELDLEPAEYVPYEEPAVNEELKQVEEAPQEREPAAAAPAEEAELDSELFCPSAGIFTYEEDCSKFVMCLIDHIHGRPRMYIMKCPGGLVFDSNANTCMQPEMSDGCKRLPAPEPEAVQPTDAPQLGYDAQNEGYPAPQGNEGYETSRVNQVFEYGY